MNALKRWIVGCLGLCSLIGFMPSLGIAQADLGDDPPCCWDMWDPGWTQRYLWGPGHMGPMQRQRMLCHWTFMHEGVPEGYRGQISSIAIDEQTIGEGGSLYAENCASCHGPTGQGDGVDGRALNPSPALLAHMIRTPMAVDEYLFWTIAEGGARFDTDMPAHKDKLEADEIWKIVAFMRAGFPGTAANGEQ
ncbi:MAG: c-type cytochrome [Geminicoccaceae bacterium]